MDNHKHESSVSRAFGNAWHRVRDSFTHFDSDDDAASKGTHAAPDADDVVSEGMHAAAHDEPQKDEPQKDEPQKDEPQKDEPHNAAFEGTHAFPDQDDIPDDAEEFVLLGDLMARPSLARRIGKQIVKLIPSIVAAVFALAALILMIVFSTSGAVTADGGTFALLIVLLIVLIAALIGRNYIPAFLMKYVKGVRGGVIVLAPIVGFLLVEIPCNNVLFSMDLGYVVVNLVIIAFLFVVVYMITQRCRACVVGFLFVCLLMGIVNHYVVMFKGFPFTPADLLAASTALEVANGYTFELDESLITAFAIFIGYCVVISLMPKMKLTLWRLVVNTALAIIVAIFFGVWVANTDYEEEYDIEMDNWFMAESFNQYGTTLCFLDMCKTLTPQEPEGYSDDAAEELMAAAEELDVQTGEIEATDDMAVIVVMNETFSDPSIYPGLEEAAQYLGAFYEISNDSLEAGTAYASTFGGGTCNSEFEALTESSFGLLGTGYMYPYTTFDFSDSFSLARYFSDLGYTTHAIHPGEATNWHRDVVYEEMGFDDFTDITAFYDDPGLRAIDLKTDRSTYDVVLNMLAEDSGSQFIFDLTIQNHGGYDRGGLEEDDLAHVTLPDGTESSDLNEYLTSLKHSDNDLAYFVEALDELDRPVVLCFFGDHQSTLSDWFYSICFGIDMEDESARDELDLELAQVEYEVPYFIWANAAARGEEAQPGKYTSATYDAKVAAGEPTYEVAEHEGDYDYGYWYEDSDGVTRWYEYEDAAEEVAPRIYYFLDDSGYFTAIYKYSGEEGEGTGTEEGAGIEWSTGGIGSAEEGQSAGTNDGIYYYYDYYAGQYVYIDVTQDERQFYYLDDDWNYVPVDIVLEEGIGAEEAQETTISVTSLNYLAAHMLSYTTLPLTGYQKMLIETSEEVPVVNVNGYMLANGTWHLLSDKDEEQPESLKELSIVQYYNLFR